MTVRMKILLLGVALLTAVNVWRWWPQVEKVAGRDTATDTAPASTAMNLNLAGYEPATGELVEVKRDLFSPVRSAEAETASRPEKQESQTTAPRSTGRETVLRELEEYKLVGVLSRNGIKQGFLVRNEDNFTVRRGDRLEKRFRVDDITLTSVTLSDPGSRVSRKIELE